MIFRTITDDITGANKSIGLFGLSLKDVSDKLNNIKINGFKNAIFNTSTLDTEAIITYNNEIAKGATAQEALATASRNTNRTTIALMKSANGATISTEQMTAAQKASTVAAKAQSVAYKAVSIAANMIAYALIAKGIQLAADAIDHYVNRAKYAAEAMEEAQQKIDDAQSTLKTMSDTLSENKERFLELSQGVSKFSNNLRLSEEDYAEYLSISNELAELFPSLVSGYDEQGNALLAIGKNADETNEKLQSVLENQQAIAQQTLIDNMDDVATGIYYEVEDAKSSIESMEIELASLQDQFKEVNVDIASSNGVINFSDDDYSKYGKAMEDALTSAGIEFEKNSGAGLYTTSINLVGSVSFDQMEKAQEFYDAWLETENKYYHASENGLKKDLEEKKKSIEVSYSKMTANLQAWVKDNYNYQYLSDTSSAIVDALVPEIKWGELEEPPTTAYGYQSYVEDNIIKPLMEIPSEYKSDVDVMFQKLLSYKDGDLNVVDFAEELQSYLDRLYEEGKISAKIDLTPIFADEKEAKDKLQNSIGEIAGDNSEDYKKLQDYTKDFNKEQANAWLNATLGANNATDAIDKYEKSLEQSLSSSKSFTEAFNSSDFKDAKENLLKLAKAGELTPYTLLSTKEYNTLLQETGLTAEQAYSEIMKIAQSDMFMEDWNNTLENARSQIAKIDELLTELDDNGQTSSFVDDIISDYPQLLEYLGDEQELREQLKALQEEQEDVARKAYTQLVSDSETYYNTFKNQETERLNTLNDTINTTISKNKSLVDTLGENYKIDLNNYKSITDAKAKLELELIKNSASAWSKFYKVQVDATTGYASIIGSTTVSPSEYLDSSGDYGAAVNKFVEEQKKQKQSAQDVVDTYNSIIASLDSIANSTNITDTSSSSSSSKDKSSDIDWIETKLNNVDKALDKLNSTIDNTYSNWTDRSKALKDVITDTEKAIGLQGQAYTKYMQKAESIKLPEYLKDRVRLGDMSIQNDVNSETKELIDEYSEWYEKAQEAKEAQDELNKSLLELKASDSVDMIEEYYDAIDEAHSNSIESTQNKIDKAETMGFFANGFYYDNIGEELAKQKANLEKKKADLDKVLLNSGLDKNSSSYTELENLISSISNEIQQLTIDIEDNKNAAQENEWNYFDYLRESVTRLIDEADFFIELMSNEDLFDDKGNFTKYADATLALHNSNYEVYMANAREYAEEMKALEEDLADGKDVIDRYRELEDAQRDAIQSAQDERKAILDLVEEGYQKQLDYLNEIIDKKKEALSAEKSLYDYQQSIQEKADKVSSLQRQYDVYSNDTSEEGLAQAQKIKVELESAKADLEQTEMEKMISDQEQMLDALSLEYETWMNARLDDENALLTQIKDEVSQKSDEIQATLKEVAGQYGTTLSTSLTSIFGSENPFDNVVTAINNLIAKISGIVGGDNTSNSNSGSGGGSVADTNKPVTQGKTTTANQNTQTDTQSKSESDGIFIPQKSVYPKNKLDKEKSVVDRLKYFDFASDFQSRATYYKKLGGTGTYTGSASQNKWLINKMKEVGYAKGTNYAKKGMHWTQEEGDEIIIRKSDGAVLTPFNWGDKVVNAEGTNNLFDFANDPQGFLEKFGVLNYAMPAVNVKMPDPSMFTRRNATNGVNLGSVNIEVGQVVANDPMEFAKQMRLTLSNDRNTQKMVQELGLGQSLGHNSMNVKRYL